ncbi:MAG: hypothetical protein ACXVCP_05085 [Bdellovibrio sp.]
MSALILWLDKEQAKLFNLNVDGVVKSSFHYHGQKHPVETLGKNHTIEQSDEEKFYHQLCEHLENVEASKWYVVGPGLARDHFLNHVEKHHNHFKQRVVGSDKMEALTDNQIIQEGVKFFRHADVFESV